MFKRKEIDSNVRAIDSNVNVRATLVLVLVTVILVSLGVLGPIFLTLYLAGLLAYTTQVLLAAILVSVLTSTVLMGLSI
jgi:hypothetical protein